MIYTQENVRREETIRNMQTIAKQLMVSFYKQSKRKPESIVMYRDGVGEGQFDVVMAYEGIKFANLNSFKVFFLPFFGFVCGGVYLFPINKLFSRNYISAQMVVHFWTWNINSNFKLLYIYFKSHAFFLNTLLNISLLLYSQSRRYSKRLKILNRAIVQSYLM